MKLKNIIALMLSVSMLACLSACGSEDSSSSKEAKEIQRETVALNESSALEAHEEASKIESEISDIDSEMSTPDSDNDSDIDLDAQSLEELMNDYDIEHPEETIIAVLKAGFKASFGENMNVTYDEKDSNYTISVWQNGFAAALDTQSGATTIENMSSDLESALEQMTTQIRLLDSDANVTFNFVSDEDNDKILLSLYNGKMTYNITEE